MSQDRPTSPRERLHDLLADRAAFGLSADETRELDRLLAQHPDVDADQFDRLAAALDVGLQPAAREPLPAGLRERIARSAAEHAGPASIPFPSSAGWVAAAACLALAVAGWWIVFVPPSAPDPAVARRQLLEGSGVVTAELDKTSPDAKATGDVVWSGREQRGFLRLRGLAVNDPRRPQYQLWIFDKNQDERYPIDGGVFDVDRAGEVVIPIRAAIRVADPTMFAITVEKPGGVVVSKRDPIVLVGKVEAGVN
jgi:anti-sigma-K factor RskA